MGMIFLFFLYLAVIFLCIFALWKTFEKAGKPGWAAIVPFYNMYVMLEIAGRPGWWLVLMFIPFVNLIFSFIVTLDIARCFGKGSGFGVGLFFLPFIFFPILAFGDTKFTGK